MVAEVSRRGAGTVAVQLPEGLKRRAAELVGRIEGETGATVVVSADPCYGACDLVEEQLEPLGVELVIHVGHTEMGDTPPRIPTLFVEAAARIDVAPAVRAAVPLLPPGGSVGLLATTQYRQGLPVAASVLEEAGLTPLVGRGGRRLAFPGQVLGCDLSAARAVAGEVDAFLIVGGGDFHAIGVALSTGATVVVADVEGGTARRLDEERDRFLRRRAGVLARAMEARTFGVLVETRPGQRRWGLALSIRDELRRAGRRPVLLVLRQLDPDRLLNLGLDAYVNTACPRLAVDDQELYGAPILTPQEARVLVGSAAWEDYRLDEMG